MLPSLGPHSMSLIGLVHCALHVFMLYFALHCHKIQAPSSTPLCRWWNWSTEKLNNMPKDIELTRSRVSGFEPRQAGAGSQAGRHSVVPLACAPMCRPCHLHTSPWQEVGNHDKYGRGWPRVLKKKSRTSRFDFKIKSWCGTVNS